MQFQIDVKSGVPFYRQLVDQVRFGAASGALRTGESLPTIRPLATQLRLNRNTVAKAYAELESLGVIRIIPGKGCFLKTAKTPFTKEACQNFLAAKIDEALVTAHQLQVESPAFLALVGERIQVFERKTAKTQSPKEHKPNIPTAKEPRTPTQPASPPSPPSPPAVSAADLGNWTPFAD